MSNCVVSVLADERFMDLNIYQYGYEQCKPLHSYGPYIRNHYLFHYVISGQGSLQIDQKGQTEEHRIFAGTGFLIEPGQVTTYCADRILPWEYTWVEFGGLRAKEILESAGLSRQSPIFIPSNTQSGDSLKEEMLYLAYHSQESPLHLMGHLYLILDALVQGSSRKKKIQGGRLSKFYTREAVAFVEQNYGLPITIEDMAQRCGLDRSYFGKIFKDTMGQSPQDFLIRYRMSKAAELLITTNVSVGDISSQVGYPNQLHFSRAFKKVYGLSPRAYRQNSYRTPLS